MDEHWHGVDPRLVHLPEPRGTEHHEDPRLFIFRERLHLAYTESLFRTPNPYTCTMNYVLLRWTRGSWQAEKIYRPGYGNNDGSHQEKNWQFFDDGGILRVLYRVDPPIVLELDGARVVNADRTNKRAAAWPWGEIRGGTPPIRISATEWLTFFHSSTWWPTEPHWRRYYAGALTFEAQAPWRALRISHMPILMGSELDGHAHDPRGIDSWKPFVVFPSGSIKDGNTWHVSYGINDYLSAIGHHTELHLGLASMEDWKPRFFRNDGNPIPVRIYGDKHNAIAWIEWKQVGKAIGGSKTGIARAGNPRTAAILAEVPDVSEITEQEFNQLNHGAFAPNLTRRVLPC